MRLTLFLRQNPAVQLWIRSVIAAAGGMLLDIATPEVSFWPAAWLGIALVLLSAWGAKPLVGLLVGLIAGACFWLPHISWLTLYLGPVPWLALSTVMVLWMGLAGVALSSVTRWFPTARASRIFRSVPALRPVALALSLSGIWVLRELLQGSVPYGGFPWGRVATMLATSPFAPLVSWLGFAGLTGIVVFLVALALTYILDALKFQRAPKNFRRWVPAGAVFLVTLSLTLVPVFGMEPTKTLKIGAVQGNSDAGIFADRQPGDILNDHIEASEPLIGESVKFFVWPEGAIDIDPIRDMDAAEKLNQIVDAVGAPLVSGIITSRNGEYYNSSIVWDPDRGVVDQYDKRRPVPFAEYMPNRTFFRSLAPDLVDLVRLDYSAGDGSSVLDVSDVTAGVAICFDIIFDDLAVDMIDQGAEVVLAQTNNADFGRTDENVQQLAIARLRAMEMGRSIVVISTVGTSAIIGANGQDIDALEPYQPGAMAADVPLYAGSTPAILFGWLFASIFILFGVSGLVLALNTRAQRVRGHRQRLRART